MFEHAARPLQRTCRPRNHRLDVLSRFFHGWERRLASVTKDRVVRPFDWGLDWIRLMRSKGACGSPLAPPRWVDEVMRDTGAFFDDSTDR